MRLFDGWIWNGLAKNEHLNPDDGLDLEDSLNFGDTQYFCFLVDKYFVHLQCTFKICHMQVVWIFQPFYLNGYSQMSLQRKM